LKKPGEPDRSPFKYASADDSAGFLLWKITALWQRKLSDVLGELGITQTQYVILASLRWFEEHDERTTQAHVAAHAKMDKMTLSKAVRRLEAMGLVAREQSSTDTRAMSVRFTPKGKDLSQKAVVAVENADDAFFSCLTDAEIHAYKSLTISVISANSPSAPEG
jgi:DNA-binding MarR family transcriptional regulator